MTTSPESTAELSSSSPELTTIPSRRSTSFREKVVMGLIQCFQNDQMEITFPNGDRQFIGDKLHHGESAPAQLTIKCKGFFTRIFQDGEIGFGEAYVAGDWDTNDLPRVIRYFIRNGEYSPSFYGAKHPPLFYNLYKNYSRLSHWLRRNTKKNSRKNISAHYDLNNNFYRLWLDQSMTYSSAYFERKEQPLQDAQKAKYDRLARRLKLQPGQHVLEIGCGWGGNAIHLATHYGVHVTGITISKEQLTLAQERVRAAGLEDRIELMFCDYRDVEGQFDAIVSIEMLEAVGHEFLQPYFEQCHRLLKASGLLGLQVILSPDSRYEFGRKTSDWIKKHIFPGGQCPSVAAINHAINQTSDLYLHHLESFGLHYAETLRQWRNVFNKHLEDVRQLGFDESFIRKWNYYLSYCEGGFDTAQINVAQLVYARPNNPYC